MACLLVICTGAIGQEPFGDRDVAPAWRQPSGAPAPAQHTLKVVRGRSCRIEARIASRAAVQDSSIASVLPLASGDLAVAGLRVGTTDLVLWGEGDARPALWRLVVTADPTVPTPETWNAAKLERRLAELFPGNCIALVPLSHEVLVKGDAASASEAARILAFVRGIVEHSQEWPPSQSIRLVAGTASDPVAEHRADVRVVDRLNVPRQPGLRVGLTVFALDRERLDALGVDLGTLPGAGPRDAESLAADPIPLRGAGLEAGEIRVLLDWLMDQGAAAPIAQTTFATPAGHTSRLAVSDGGAVRNHVHDRFRRAAPLDFRLAITAWPNERGGIRLQLDTEVESRATPPHSGTADLRDLVRITRRSKTESEVLTGQVLASVLHSDAASGAGTIQVPLLGELRLPAKPGPQAGGPVPASAAAVLIIVAPEDLREFR